MILIAGNLPFKTEVASLYVFQRLNSGDTEGAAALAVLLLVISLARPPRRSAASAGGRRAMTARRVIRYGSLGYLAVILVAPVGLIFWRAFEHGLAPFWDAISNPDAVHALKLTLEVTVVAVPLNTVFGVLCGLAIVRHRIPGHGARQRARRPADGALAGRRRARALPALREQRLVRPVARRSTACGSCSRTRASCSRRSSSRCRSSCARSCRCCARSAPSRRKPRPRSARRAFTTFRRITLPAIRWAVAYGVVLTTARALGEFGAVAIVSGGHRGADADDDAVRAGGVRERCERDRGVRRVRRCSPRSRS